MPLILGANVSGILKWWVDASFAVHPNMRGHSGGPLSLGRGFPIVSSTKQKLNTQSSTETEIVGADDFMRAIYWTCYFMKAQGYDVKDNVLFQDNKSSILLEKMVRLQAENAQSTSTFGISLLQTELARKKFRWSGVLRETCLETTRPNHSRGLYSGSLETI
jgi:hypothetical protein